MYQSFWPYLMTLANFLHPLLSPHKSNSHIVILRKSPSALSAMGVFFHLLLEILSSVSLFLCLLFSGAKPYRWRILRHLKTTVLLVYHLTFFLFLFFQDLLQTNWSVFLASGLLNCGRKYKKSFPAIGRDGHVLSLKDISVLLPSVN